MQVRPMYQKKVAAETNATGSIFIQKIYDIFPKYKLRATNGVSEVFPEKPLRTLLSKFGAHGRKFPEGIVFAFGAKHTLDIVPIFGKDGE